MGARSLVTSAMLVGTVSACSFVVSLDGLQDGGTSDAPNDGGQIADAIADAADARPGDAATGDDAGPPPTFVQANAAAGGGSSMVVVSLGATHAGNALVVAVGCRTNVTVTVADDQGDTFSSFVGPQDDAPLNTRQYLFAAFGTHGGATSVTVVATASIDFFDAYAHEYANVTSFDVGGTGSGSDTTTDGLTTGGMKCGGNEMLVAYAGATTSAAAGTNFNLRSSFDQNVSEDRLLVSAGTYMATATLASGASGLITAGCFR